MAARGRCGNGETLPAVSGKIGQSVVYSKHQQEQTKPPSNTSTENEGEDRALLQSLRVRTHKSADRAELAVVPCVHFHDWT